jgi:hypothetical protein
MDPRIHSRGYKRKRQQGETFGLCDPSCVSSHTHAEIGRGTGQASVASERSPSLVPSYVTEVAKASKKNAHLKLKVDFAAVLQITAIYAELLSRLPALHTEHTSYDAAPNPLQRLPARRTPNALVLQDLAKLAFEGVDLVARCHQAFVTRRDRYPGDSSWAAVDKEQQTPIGTHLLTERNVDAYGRQTDSDQYHSSAPNFRTGVRLGEQSFPDHHSTGTSVRPSSTFASQPAQLAHYKAFPDDAYESRAIARPTSTSIEYPIPGRSANAPPTTHTYGRHLPPESLQGSNTSSSGSSVRCLNCDKRETPEWRKGPYGPRTLCNACVS